MPRSLNLPQAILAIALHAAGRPLLTQELAVLAGKPQEAIASLLEPLLGAGFVAHTEAPGAWVCPGLPDAVRDEFVRLLIRNAPPGSLTHALARLGAPDMALDDCTAIAEAIGDDRLQQQSQGRVVPDSFTHGTSKQRYTWFKRGFDSGDPAQCNTFGSAL